VRDLAEGGMGRVELALREEGRFRRVYAIKRLHDQFLDDPDLRAMFLEEARIAGLLRHPNLVSVIDTGEDERGPYLVMDFVEGVPLSRVIGRGAATGEHVPAQVCVNLARQIADGLHAAHELTDLEGNPLHLVHRDVSPQNVIVGFDGVARLTDFGIAKAFGRAHRTTTGILKGKSGYFSPEQLQFEEPDRRSDIFCLGIVLFELLSSRRLYGGDDPVAAAKRILREPPPDIAEDRPDAHPMLVKLLFEVLAKDPEQRPADARAVAQVLEQIEMELSLDEEPIRPADYVNAHFEDVRERQREEVRAMTQSGVTVSEEASTEPGSHRRPTGSAAVGSEPVSTKVETPRARSPGPATWRARSIATVVAGLVVGAVAVAVTAAWALGGPDEAEPEVPAVNEVVEEPVAATAPPTEVERAAPVSAPEAGGGESEEASATTAAAAAVEAEGSRAPRATRADRVRREARRRDTTAARPAGTGANDEDESGGESGGAAETAPATGAGAAASETGAPAPDAERAPAAESETPPRRNPELMRWPERNPPSR
jgi:serine/threonine-protein kinase